MFIFIKKVFYMGSLFSLSLVGTTSLNCISMKYQECKTILIFIKIIPIVILIYLYQWKIWKKREFLNRGSSSSNNDDVSKRVKENENTSSSTGNVTDGNVGSTETVNKLVSCMEPVQKQITLIFQNTNDLRDNQIKGTRQYEIQESLQAISDRFDDYEADRKKKDETINRLENEVGVLNVKVS